MKKNEENKKPKETNIDAVLKEIIKEFGEESIMKAAEKRKIDIDVLPTGIMSLDDALGIGGIPKGRIIEIFGPESSGKTTLSLQLIAQAQKLGMLCAFVDAEHSLDLKYSSQLGVDTSKLLISQPDCGEDALNITEKLVNSKKVGLIIIDSVAALTPRAEIDGIMGQTHIGLQARLMSQALRKLAAICSRTNTIVVFINQIRLKIGMAWGNPETTTGGVALKFYTSVRIEVRQSVKLKKNEEIIGNRIKVKIAKNKIASPYKTTEYDIIYGEGISQVADIVNLGLEHDVIEKEGNTLTFETKKLGRSLEKTKEFLKENPDVLEEIIKKVKERLGKPKIKSITEDTEE